MQISFILSYVSTWVLGLQLDSMFLKVFFQPKWFCDAVFLSLVVLACIVESKLFAVQKSKTFFFNFSTSHC